MPSFELESAYQGIVVGIDEAGRGPLAGPVVAAAVYIPTPYDGAAFDFLAEVKDSKKLTAAKREALFEPIIKHCQFGIAFADAAEVDDINILQATFLAMNRAVDALTMGFDVVPDMALVDGNQKPRGMDGFAVRPVIKGDDVSYSIACASILAKVTRDRVMQKLDAEFPHYGWAKNAGYGTAQHMAAIAQFGVCEHHRQSFAPIKNAISALRAA